MPTSAWMIADLEHRLRERDDWHPAEYCHPADKCPNEERAERAEAALTAKDEEIARLRAEHQELREIILAWWNDPDNPPAGAALLARIETP